MKMKFIALLTVLVMLPALVFAAPVIVTWEWLLDDPEVTSFRYQLNGEEDGNWTVVDAFVTSYTEYDLDSSVPHSLYLQQSYDGIHFSESAVSVAMPLPSDDWQEAEALQPVDEVVEEPVVAEVVEVPEEVVVVAEPVAAPAPVAKKAKAPSTFYTTITVGGTFDWQILNPALPSYSDYNGQVGLGLNFNNIAKLNKAIGLGLDVDVAYAPYLSAAQGWNQAGKDLIGFKFADFFGAFDHALTVSAAPMLNFHSSKVAFDLGVGGFFTWGPELKDVGSNMFYGVEAKTALAYRFNKRVSLGVAAKYGLVLSEGFAGGIKDMPMFLDGSLFVGFSF
jgi:hypothetical protein